MVTQYASAGLGAKSDLQANEQTQQSEKVVLETKSGADVQVDGPVNSTVAANAPTIEAGAKLTRPIATMVPAQQRMLNTLSDARNFIEDVGKPGDPTWDFAMASVEHAERDATQVALATDALVHVIETEGLGVPVVSDSGGAIEITSTPQAGTAPQFVRSEPVPVSDRPTPDAATASIIIASAVRNREVVAISTTTFIALLEAQIEQVNIELPQINDPDRIAELQQDLREYEALKQKAYDVQQANVQFSKDPTKEKENAVVGASISFKEGVQNWWTEKHVSICNDAFKTGLFLAAETVSWLIGIPVLGATISGAIIGGKPVVQVLKRYFPKK